MSDLATFDLEVYFAKYEFSAKYLLGSSDLETVEMSSILESDAVDESLRNEWKNLRLGYTETPGLPALREQVALNYDGLTSEDIFTFSGAEEAIYATMRALLKKGRDHVIILLPAYQSLYSVAVDVLGEEGVTAVDMKSSEGKWHLPLEEIQAALQRNTAMMVFNFPHNPTGSLITPQEQQALIDIAKSGNNGEGIYIFFDEVYRGLEADVSMRLPPMCTLYDKGLSLGVMSKSLGLAGLRVGWLACKDITATTKIMNYKLYLSICNSAPSELISLMALKQQESMLQRNRQIVADNRVLIDMFLQEYSDLFEWNAPLAGCIGLMKLKRGDIDAFAEKMIEYGSVMLLPGHLFPSVDKEITRNTFRFGFGRLNFLEAMTAFRRAIEMWKERDI